MKQLKLREKGLLIFLSFLVFSCSSCRQWEYSCERTPCIEYSSSRMILPTQGKDNLSLELISTISGLRMYVNVYSIPPPSLPCDDKKIEVVISIENTSFAVLSERLIGGQRFLLPARTAELIIQALLNYQTVQIAIGRYRAEIIPRAFQEHYFKMFPEVRLH